MTLIIVKTWSRLLISNYAWHLPGCFGLPFSCLLLGRVIEDRCLSLPGKGGTWHTACSTLCLETCCFPEKRDWKGLPQQVDRPKGGSQNRVPFAKHFCFYCPFLSIAASALRREEPEPRAVSRASSRDLLKCYLLSLIGELGTEALGKKAGKSHVISTRPSLPLHLHSYLDQDGDSVRLGIGK